MSIHFYFDELGIVISEDLYVTAAIYNLEELVDPPILFVVSLSLTMDGGILKLNTTAVNVDKTRGINPFILLVSAII